MGHCAKGDDCVYLHDLSNTPCQYHHLKETYPGGCKRNPCQYSHAVLTPERLEKFKKLVESRAAERKRGFDQSQVPPEAPLSNPFASVLVPFSSGPTSVSTPFHPTSFSSAGEDQSFHLNDKNSSNSGQKSRSTSPSSPEDTQFIPDECADDSNDQYEQFGSNLNLEISRELDDSLQAEATQLLDEFATDADLGKGLSLD